MEPEVAKDIRIVWDDEAVVVIEKPAPLPMHAVAAVPLKRLPVGVAMQGHPGPVIEAGALEGAVADLEAERFDQVELGTGGSAGCRCGP